MELRRGSPVESLRRTKSRAPEAHRFSYPAAERTEIRSSPPRRSREFSQRRADTTQVAHFERISGQRAHQPSNGIIRQLLFGARRLYELCLLDVADIDHAPIAG